MKKQYRIISLFFAFVFSFIGVFGLSVDSFSSEMTPYEALEEYVHQEFLNHPLEYLAHANATYGAWSKIEDFVLTSPFAQFINRGVELYSNADPDSDMWEYYWQEGKDNIVRYYISQKFTKMKVKEILANTMGFIGSDSEDFYTRLQQVAMEYDGIKEYVMTPEGYNEWFSQQFGYGNFEKKNPNRGIVNGVADLNFDITISPELQQCCQKLVDEEVAEAEFYECYSLNLGNYVTEFSNGNLYNNVRQFLLQYQDDYYCFTTYGNAQSSNSSFSFYIVPKSAKVCFVLGSSREKENLLNGGYTCVNWFNTQTWSTSVGLLTPSEEWGNKVFVVKDSGIEEVYKIGKASGASYFPHVYGSRVPSSHAFGYSWLTFGCIDSALVFQDINKAKEYNVGSPSFYTTSQYGQTPLSVLNTGKMDTGVNYGTVNDYVSNYYNEKGNYPSQGDIQNWINIQINGGGSGGNGNSDTGGSGNNNTGSDTNVWDWLGGVGSFLGDLIGALGQAILGLLDGVKELIYALISDVPQVFSEFMQNFFSWLPPEISALIGLSVSAMIIFGIIKLIRGS